MSVYLKKGSYYIDYYFKGRRLREKIGPSKQLAITVLHKRKVEIAEKRFLNVKEQPKISFESLADDYLNKYSKVNKRSWWRDVYSIKALSSYFSGKSIGEINVQSVEQYKAKRIKEVKPATVNKELICLKGMFNRAVDSEIIEVSPITKVKPFKANGKRLRYLEKEEIKRFLESCPPKLQSIVILALNTGMRKGEIQNLKWQDIDFRNGFICIAQQKNGEKSYQPLNNSSRQAILSVKKHRTSPYVFCKEDGTTYNLRKSFETSLKKASILDGSVTFHTLRHSFASHLAMAGVDLNTIRELMRHKDFATTLRYAHLSRNHTTKAVNVLAAQLADQTPIQTPEQIEDLQSKQALLISSSNI